MGILNINEDSFYDGGKHNSIDKALLQTERMLSDGAFFIDIGAASSKPGSPIIKPEVELKKLLPILQALINQFPKTYFSIDTYNSKVAKEALNIGASMINDISAGRIDPEIFKTVADFRVPYVLMHMQGTPKSMQEQPQYDNITKEIKFDLIQQIQDATAQGITDLIIDPGFGFGKNIIHNYQLLRELNSLTDLNCPVLVGVSRKSMIYKVLKTGPDMALNGTTALHAWALERGASILRVHDVKEAKECIDLWTALQ
ncbi:MAG: dihydropteroate synthase [Flavobacteriaceae bacterium TMED48]|jgi:dihydropteroate synthase|nr:MAG: dihydropteroate synthase [Flavobacteriaceae bacterium TMED48]|tara:strand:+ start:2851 stop:3621 length:771 start_codon:yes stop_codon:yes gene_type:complete